MTHTILAPKTKTSNKNRIDKRLKKIVYIAGFLFIAGLNILAQSAGGALSPQNAETGSKADQNLKSVARVNPSTLAMEMSLPLATYPGRGGTNLPSDSVIRRRFGE
ncbi:MAG TPA: hypothetical protein VGC76_02780 [Pyrinomonadaceae bacterium]|jgi:hypothetical protein